MPSDAPKRTACDHLPQSERTACAWLQQVGCTSIEHVGDAAHEGPPDFVAEFRGEEVAVEASLLQEQAEDDAHGQGWRETERIAFESALRDTIRGYYEENPDAPQWHIVCEFDPQEDGPPKLHTKRGHRARDRVAEALSGNLSTPLQLLPESRRRGRGVTLDLWPTSGEWWLGPVGSDEGGYLPLADRVADVVADKTEKVANGRRASRYDRWWLVLDDEVLIVPYTLLDDRERREIKAQVRECPGRERWSKIVLVSRFQSEPPPPKLPKHHWPLWEHPDDPALPS